jgi:hypothetical protein
VPLVFLLNKTKITVFAVIFQIEVKIDIVVVIDGLDVFIEFRER